MFVYSIKISLRHIKNLQAGSVTQSFVLLLLFHNILSDLPIELANIIVDLVQVFLDQQLNIRVFHVGQVSVLRPVHAPIEIPAGWQVLVEEFVLNRSNLLIRHISLKHMAMHKHSAHLLRANIRSGTQRTLD